MKMRGGQYRSASESGLTGRRQNHHLRRTLPSASIANEQRGPPLLQSVRELYKRAVEPVARGTTEGPSASLVIGWHHKARNHRRAKRSRRRERRIVSDT